MKLVVDAEVHCTAQEEIRLKRMDMSSQFCCSAYGWRVLYRFSVEDVGPNESLDSVLAGLKEVLDAFDNSFCKGATELVVQQFHLILRMRNECGLHKYIG